MSDPTTPTKPILTPFPQSVPHTAGATTTTVPHPTLTAPVATPSVFRPTVADAIASQQEAIMRIFATYGMDSMSQQKAWRALLAVFTTA